MLKLCGQGSVYIRSYELLDDDSDCESVLDHEIHTSEADGSEYPSVHAETSSISQQIQEHDSEVVHQPQASARTIEN